MSRAYCGRFAPSPSGPLHRGSLVAALASWLDARAHQGLWFVRMEDVDSTRCRPGVAEWILQQLAACGLHSDRPVLYQSTRSAQYQQALDDLVARALAYPCACTRAQIARLVGTAQSSAAPRPTELIYPGTCRERTLTGHTLAGHTPPAWRLRTDLVASSPGRPMTKAPALHWFDRRLGAQQQDVASAVGDFVLKRADGCFTYQLAVVVDDAAQGITDVVRGADLADNTARQILLQQALGLPTPRYLHTPLVLAANGEKLSKQNAAQALALADPLQALNQAAQELALPAQTGTLATALNAWVQAYSSASSSSTSSISPTATEP